MLLMLDGCWITSCRAKPHVSPKAPGNRSEPSNRNVVALASWWASARPRRFGYAEDGTFLFGEMTAPVETQVCPASGVEMNFRNWRTSGVSLNAAAKSAPPTTGRSSEALIVGHG